MGKQKGEFTINAILNQPDTWKSTINIVENNKKDILSCFEDIDHVIFTGCGSNYYMSLASASHFQYLTWIPSKGVPASEIYLNPDTVFKGLKNVLVISLSRSGETTEVVKAIDFVNNNTGFKTLYIGCYPESMAARSCFYKIPLTGAREKSVVTTKSYTSMFLAVQLIAGHLSRNKEIHSDKYLEELRHLPEPGKKLIDKYDRDLKSFSYEKFVHFVFLGSGPFYGIACESMLKMKEMALVPSDAFHFLEFRHGPKSILSKDVLVTGFLSDTGAPYEIDLTEEIKRLGGSTLIICEKGGAEINACADILFETGTNISEYARSILYLPAIQLLAYNKALSKGIDVDVPKNLTHYVSLPEINNVP